MNKSQAKKTTFAASDRRRRGRPAGKPTPLNAEQKRATNRAYERERREEQRQQQAELAQALGATDKESLQQILLLMLSRVRQAADQPSVKKLRAQNNALRDEIAAAEAALQALPGSSEDPV